MTHTETVQLGLGTGEVEGLASTLWPYGDEDGWVELEIECYCYPGEPRTREHPGAPDEAEAYELYAVVDGARYELPDWAWGALDEQLDESEREALVQWDGVGEFRIW